MKAAVLYKAKEPLKIEDLRQDPPKHGEVVVRIGVAGVCASDHHVMDGTAQFPLPIVLGHEGAGTVEAVGPGVTRVKPGDRCILSFAPSCGWCHYCCTGQGQLCSTHRSTGSRQFDNTVRLHYADTDVFQMQKLGVFAERAVVPQEACATIPEKVPMEVAALMGCCVATGVGALINQPGIKTGISVAVFGCGGVGLNVLQGARLLSATRVIAVDIHDHKLEFAFRFGATHTVNARREDPVAAIRRITGGGVDFAVDSFGSKLTAGQAIQSVRTGGTAVLVGLAPTGEAVPVDMVDAVRNQKSIAGSYYGSASPQETFSKLIDFYLTGKIDVEGMVTRRYPLEKINEGFAALARGEDGRGVIVFEP
ncbi:MAG: Zn-dependent alcohol dehydrogenase [Chloroflexi bacterium]|nr:Zn-dependent alcohol dehydrogenase [Chloroflexota bacterium]